MDGLQDYENICIFLLRRVYGIKTMAASYVLTVNKHCGNSSPATTTKLLSMSPKIAGCPSQGDSFVYIERFPFPVLDGIHERDGGTCNSESY